MPLPGRHSAGCPESRRSYSTRLSRHLRRNLTKTEARLWVVLRSDFDQKFRRQEPIGPYIVDFVCYEHRLIVEPTGHSTSRVPETSRDAYLSDLGFRVLRVASADVMSDLEPVTSTIETELLAYRRVTQPINRLRPDS